MLKQIEALGTQLPELVVHEINGKEANVLTYKQAKAVKSTSELKDKLVVLDGATWYGRPVSDAKVVWSGNGVDRIGSYNTSKLTFSEFESLLNEAMKTELKPLYFDEFTDSVNEINNPMKGGPNMDPMQQLKDMAAGAQAAPTTAQMNLKAPRGPLTEQQKAANKAKAEQKKAEANQFSNRINMMVSNVTATIPTDLVAFNHTHGRLLGFVTANDSKVAFSIAKDNKNDATATTQTDNANVNYVLRVADRKPGKIKAVALSVPESTFISLNDLFSNPDKIDTAKLIGSKPTMIKDVFAADEAHSLIVLYFGGEILEDEAVWANSPFPGQQGKVICGMKQVTTKDSRALKPFWKAVRGDLGINSLLVGWNYFPLKMYKTIAIGSSTAVAPADLDALVQTVYRPLATKSGDTNTTKFDRLTAESKALFQVEGDSVKVDYFRPDKAAHQSLMMLKPFWAPRSENAQFFAAKNGVLELAYKHEVASKDETKAKRFVFATIGILDEESNMIYNKFASFVNVVGKDVLSVDKLREYTRRTTTQARTAGEVTGTTAQKLLLGGMTNRLSKDVQGLQYNVNVDMDSLQAIVAESRASLYSRVDA